MLKRSIAIFLVILLVGGIFTACQASISSNEAIQIALEDMGADEADVQSVHVHEGTYQNQECYNVYLTVDGTSMTYVIAVSGGSILAKMEGSGHSH